MIAATGTDRLADFRAQVDRFRIDVERTTAGLRSAERILRIAESHLNETAEKPP